MLTTDGKTTKDDRLSTADRMEVDANATERWIELRFEADLKNVAGARSVKGGWAGRAREVGRYISGRTTQANVFRVQL